MRRSNSILYLAIGFALLGLACALNAAIKPTGVFSSSGATSDEVLAHESVRGVLVRVRWDEIESSPGVFDFTRIESQISKLKLAGKHWSLGIAGGGVGSPDWLIDTLGVPYVDYSFRSEPGYRLPLFWNETVQERIALMANAVAAAYGADERLALVYVTQMTSNGLEGHLQGVNMGTLVTAGYTDEKWIEASKSASRSFAAAFLQKAIAFEVHDINGGATVPSQIINELWAEPGLEQRVGAAMWWLSGSETYQSALIQVLSDFPGDIYAQVIGKSEDTSRFRDGDYTTVFQQAREIGIRDIEPWEWEFKSGTLSAAGAWDQLIRDFTTWADLNSAQTSSQAGKHGPPSGMIVGEDFLFRWLAIKGQTYTIKRSTNLIDWEMVIEVTSETSDWMSIPDLGALAENGRPAGFYRVE